MQKNPGFTLIELSIVIVIIGLIVAGVVSGQQLVKQAKLKTVMQDVKKYRVANNTFFLKYNEYAGDMLSVNTNAYWGFNNKDGVYSVPGDKKIEANSEVLRSWHHLQLAGIIKGNYTGTYANDEVPGINVGASRYASDAGFNIHTLSLSNNQWGYGTNDIYDLGNITVMFFGKVKNTSSHILPNAVLTPKEAYQIDSKYDDGLPNHGQILADHGTDVGNNNQCLDYTKYASAYNAPGDDGRTYVLSKTTPTCRMMFTLR